MIFWAILTVLITLVAVAITISLVKRYDAQPEVGSLTVLMDQLNDVDAQEKSRAISADTAEQLRIEIKRRMLTEGNAARPSRAPFSARARMGIAFGVVGTIAVGVTAIYAMSGEPGQGPGASGDASALAQSGEGAGEHPAGDAEAMVRTLEQRLEAEPNDAEGWRMLGWSYFQLRRFADSAEAYGRASKVDPSDPSYVSAMGESLVQAADGIVTPKAKSAFEAARQRDPTDARARYFLAVMKDQQGDVAGAINEWIALLAESPADAPWVPHLRDTITKSAEKAGVDVSARMPAVAPIASGPTQADMAAAAQLSTGDREAMISSMVDGLAKKLAANPNDAQGWLRLMRARMVQGDRKAAASAYQTAQQTFANDPAQLSLLKKAADEMGL